MNEKCKNLLTRDVWFQIKSSTSGLPDVSVTSRAATGPTFSLSRSTAGSGPLSSRNLPRPPTAARTTGPRAEGNYYFLFSFWLTHKYQHSNFEPLNYRQ